MPTPVFFKATAVFRACFKNHTDTGMELIVGFYKLAIGHARLHGLSQWVSHCAEVESIACARMDDSAYKIRFTPHKRSFAWSAINIELAAVAPQEEALFRRNKVA